MLPTHDISEQQRIVIIGAGPTGLGAAYRLHEIAHHNFRIYEKNDYVGGLSHTFKDEKVSSRRCIC